MVSQVTFLGVFGNYGKIIKELYGSRNLLGQLIARQLVLRYRRTVLGYLWTLINPLLMMSVMALVFSTLFKVELKTFAVFLFTGMIPWNFFNSVVTQSGNSLIGNESLIKKVYLPKVVFPLSVASALLVDSLFSFFALFAIILAIGGSLSWTVLFVFVAYMMLFFFALGIGLVLSVATVFFRDLQYVTGIIMQGLFFLTPIFYQHDRLGGGAAWLVGLNPVVPFIDLFRAPLYLNSLPNADTVLQAIVLSFSAMVAGLSVFLWQEKRIIFRL